MYATQLETHVHKCNYLEGTILYSVEIQKYGVSTNAECANTEIRFGYLAQIQFKSRGSVALKSGNFLLSYNNITPRPLSCNAQVDKDHNNDDDRWDIW